MRCIEIKFNGPIETQQDWLTLTWDVLKLNGLICLTFCC